MSLFRTNDNLENYVKFKNSIPNDYCPFCDTNNIVTTRTIVKKYNYWTMIENDFPYDKVARVHQLLVLNRHVGKEKDLTIAELTELVQLKNQLLENDDYEFLENNIRRRSIPNHFHIHLLIWR